MYLTKEEFNKIKQKHNGLLLMEDDVREAFDFVQEVLEAEADAMREKCSYATVSIKEADAAAAQVFDIAQEIDNEEFGEEES